MIFYLKLAEEETSVAWIKFKIAKLENACPLKAKVYVTAQLIHADTAMSSSGSGFKC